MGNIPCHKFTASGGIYFGITPYHNIWDAFQPYQLLPTPFHLPICFPCPLNPPQPIHRIPANDESVLHFTSRFNLTRHRAIALIPLPFVHGPPTTRMPFALSPILKTHPEPWIRPVSSVPHPSYVNSSDFNVNSGDFNVNSSQCRNYIPQVMAE